MEKRHPRPFAVTLLALAVFLLGMGYFLQSGQALSHYALNRELPLSVPAWYPPLSGGIWGAAWLILAIGLWRWKQWARRLTLIVIPIQVLFWLADWLILSRSSIAIQSFWFDLTARLILAGAGAAILLLSGSRDTPGALAPAQERESAQSHVE